MRPAARRSIRPTIGDVGFQLSAAATAGLLAWASRLARLAGAHRLRRLTPAGCVEALAVSLAAQAATLPLVLLQFGRLSLVAPLANLLVAPLVAPVMLLTAICLVAGAAVAFGVPALLFAPVTLIGSLGIGAMIAIAHTAAALPFATVALPPPFNLGAALASLIVVALVVRRRAANGRAHSGVDPGPPSAARRLASRRHACR